jgi:hypothetical protein
MLVAVGLKMMIVIAPLTDLLPSLFDSIVLRLTQRPLLTAERNAILTALVNGIGESVLRRIQHAALVEGASTSTKEVAAAAPTSKDVTEIETADRFSDEWMPRLEIVHGIEYSSGLDHTLSEFALFLMECRLDAMLAAGSSAIAGLGEISAGRSVYEVHPTSQEVLNLLDQASARPAAAERGSLWRFFFGEQTDDAARYLVEKAQLIASMRQPLSCKIALAETLAYKSDNRIAKVIDIKVSEDNRVIDPGKRPPERVTYQPATVLDAGPQLQPVSQTRVPT